MLYQRNENRWSWIEGGTIQRYPELGSPVVVAYNKTKFSHTEPITEIIRIDESEPNALQVVFMDKNAVWMLELPAHANDFKAIRKALK